LNKPVFRKVHFVKREATIRKPAVSLVVKGADIFCIYRGDRRDALNIVQDVFVAMSAADANDTLEPLVTADHEPLEDAIRQQL
jgi:hypothetical protein